MLGSHFLNCCLHLANRRGKRPQSIVQASGLHYVQSNISPSIGQLPLPERQSEQPQTSRNHARKGCDRASERINRAPSGWKPAGINRLGGKIDPREAQATTLTYALFTQVNSPKRAQNSAGSTSPRIYWLYSTAIRDNVAQSESPRFPPLTRRRADRARRLSARKRRPDSRR
jgi:hypothetical protein